MLRFWLPNVRNMSLNLLTLMNWLPTKGKPVAQLLRC